MTLSTDFHLAPTDTLHAHVGAETVFITASRPGSAVRVTFYASPAQARALLGQLTNAVAMIDATQEARAKVAAEPREVGR